MWVALSVYKYRIDLSGKEKQLLRQANGLRYPRVGGRRKRRFAGTSLQPATCLKTRRLPPVGCTLY